MSYLCWSSIRSPNTQQCVSVNREDSSGLKGLCLDGAAVHVEGGGAVFHAQGQLVPAEVHEGLYPLPGENAADQVSRGVHPSGSNGQGAISSTQVH